MMRKLGMFVFIYLLLAGDFLVIHCVDIKDPPTLGSKYSPRVLARGINAGGFQYSAPQNHTVFYYNADSEELYVGGTNFVLKLDVDDFRVLENFSLNTTWQEKCEEEGPCENVITLIERFQDSLFVCGTNGYTPQCWKLFPSVDAQPPDIILSYEGMGIAPYKHTQNTLSLTVEGDLYSAAPGFPDGSMLQFRRRAGIGTVVWMYDNWVSEPTFISASWVKRKEDPDNEKIYIFFREKNRDNNPEADPWISRVARICKVDEGGSKRLFQNMWTTFLKARLVCGFSGESLYFNRLQDIYVMEAEDWRDTRVYALFSSSWNSTAVCIYTVRTIEDIFENSTFKGYDEDIPKPRPGTCQKNSKSLPSSTINVVKEHPEMTNWVHSAPLYISTYNYTKIVVDQVQAADQRMYNVLLLSTDSGKIHKVLEAGSEPFIISETQLFSHSTLQSIKLDSKKKKLVVGFSEKISTVDLQRCQDYTESCADCVLARDPYCAWTEFGCTSNVSGGIQDIMTGNRSVCTSVKVEKQASRTKRETPVDLTLHFVPLGVPFYLSCPIDSYHAEYTWRHGNQTHPCLQMQSNCLHLIPSMAPENYGTYECVSKEKDYVKVVKNYQLEEQQIPNPIPNDPSRFPNRFSNLFPNRISNLDPNLISNLDPNLISNLDPNLISNLNPNLNPNLISNLNPNLISNLNPYLNPNLNPYLNPNLIPDVTERDEQSNGAFIVAPQICGILGVVVAVMGIFR